MNNWLALVVIAAFGAVAVFVGVGAGILLSNVIWTAITSCST